MTEKDDKKQPTADNKQQNKTVSAADAAKIAAQAKSNLSSNNDAKPAEQTSPKAADKTTAKKASKASEKLTAKETEQAASAGKTKVTSPPVKKSPTRPTASNSNAGKPGISKTAVLALLLAIGAGAAVGYLYQYQNTTLAQQGQQLNQQTKQSLAELDQHLQKQISDLQSTQQKRVSEVIEQFEQRNKSKIAELEGEIKQLLERQPQNWQITEAEYLTRMAGRVLWLEKDTQTAISLLHDADARIKELKDPRLLAIREMIHQDIESLKTLPKLERQDIILSLMALSQQVDKLPLSSVQIPEPIEVTESNALSEDIGDWKQNLAKSWRKFKDEFITVRYRTANVEPLMAPDQEQNLLQNMRLKFQLAQWAVSKGESELYVESMNDISQWLNDYFDMTEAATQKFNMRLSQLRIKPVDVDYPQQMQSQQALRKMLDNKSYDQRPSTKSPSQPKDEPKDNASETTEGNV
ncbi:uroporphyrinogen-III C-methyltransferase [Thalassotalea sp. Y01]|uniref:uroporphyrinogen-III C-methyltransferase n=1 Tax=Thalassotalea sp. Y01 TaxID=2729613 RepID=UPI00145E6E2A|nr:uroporphyrinogen-III C-methyltransferase [Thalassotalea sp. Y01]NMP16061.1 heme biosynthesis operon protein HemX [Thalassotalea sp. Y01]